MGKNADGKSSGDCHLGRNLATTHKEIQVTGKCIPGFAVSLSPSDSFRKPWKPGGWGGFFIGKLACSTLPMYPCVQDLRRPDPCQCQDPGKVWLLTKLEAGGGDRTTHGPLVCTNGQGQKHSLKGSRKQRTRAQGSRFWRCGFLSLHSWSLAL